MAQAAVRETEAVVERVVVEAAVVEAEDRAEAAETVARVTETVLVRAWARVPVPTRHRWNRRPHPIRRRRRWPAARR